MKNPPQVFQDVVDFHKKFGIQYAGPPRDLPDNVAEFRWKRLIEELMEIQYSKTPEERLDGFVDLIYIVLGTVHLYGWDFDEAWRRVHRANMAKELCHPNNPGKYGKLGNKLDIVKPKNWKAPDLSDLV